jgi:dTDP-4-amino-4,6-dideoxygalactose transaminase
VIQHFGLVRQYANLKDELLDASDRAMREGCLVDGPYVDQFEHWLSGRTDAQYAVTCHSGTQALEIIARYRFGVYHSFLKENMVIGPHPIVRLPNLTYPATMNAFINAGWKVELVDTDRNGIMLRTTGDSPNEYYDCPVGLYGARPDNNDKYDVGTFLDGAQHWLVAEGNIGIGMAISFDPTKNLPSSGNGGAIVTRNEDLYNFARNYRNNGKLSNHGTSGSNSKMSEQDCAQILVRTKYINEWQQRRGMIAAHWCRELAQLEYQTPGLRCLSQGVAYHAHQKFVIYTEDRVALGAYLLGKGIECKIHYPYTLSELLVARDFIKPDMLSTSVMLSRGVLSLPIYPELTDAEIEHISETILQYFNDK